MTHTPTPWRVEADERLYEVNGKLTDQTYIVGYNIVDATGDEVIGCEGITDADDTRAAFIVKAVNAHDNLVEALKVARALILQEADVAARAGQMDRLEAGAARITAALEGLE